MNKRTKLCAALVAAVMAIGLMCFGFAQWSTEINLNGSVSASGSWEVKVADAAVELSNAGAQLVDGVVEVHPTYDVVVYPIYVDYQNNYYYFQVDDAAAETVSITAEEFAAYDTSMGVSAFSSGAKSGDYTFRLSKAEGVENMVANWYNRTSLKAADGGAMDGQCIGKAIAWCYKGVSTSEPENSNVVLTYAAAKSYFAAHPAGTETVAAETSFTDTEVTYAPVNFSLPGAWANYKVTIVNNGTSSANLSNAVLEFDALDESVYSVDTPDLSGKILAPGESCTINLVVKVVAEDSFSADAQSFHVTLNYVQDAVDEAPSAGYTQG